MMDQSATLIAMAVGAAVVLVSYLIIDHVDYLLRKKNEEE